MGSCSFSNAIGDKLADVTAADFMGLDRHGQGVLARMQMPVTSSTSKFDQPWPRYSPTLWPLTYTWERSRNTG